MQIKVGLCQIRVEDDKAANIRKAELAVESAARQGAELIILPEMFNCPYQQKFFPLFAETESEGETVRRLAELAQKFQCYLVGGSIPESDAGAIYNTSLIFGRDGKVIGKHRKVHLFDIDVPGRIAFKESAVLAAGDHTTIVDTDLGRLGVAICYDLRFPDFLRTMKKEGADVFIIPAAFNHVTGPAHWEVLLRARAIDNQVFVVAVGPARNVAAEYQAYGHSMAVSPWGEVLWAAGDEEAVQVVSLDLDQLAKVRREMPIEEHRREELY